MKYLEAQHDLINVYCVPCKMCNLIDILLVFPGFPWPESWEKWSHTPLMLTIHETSTETSNSIYITKCYLNKCSSMVHFSQSLQWSVWSISLRPGQSEGVESVTAVSSFPRAIGQFHIKTSRDDCVQSRAWGRDTVNGTFTKAERKRCLSDCDIYTQFNPWELQAQAAVSLHRLCQHISLTSNGDQLNTLIRAECFWAAEARFLGARRPCESQRQQNEHGHPN